MNKTVKLICRVLVCVLMLALLTGCGGKAEPADSVQTVNEGGEESVAHGASVDEVEDAEETEPEPAPEPTLPLVVVGDKAQLVEKNPADNAEVKVGESFDITWTLRNVGSTVWTDGYYLRYYQGDKLAKSGTDRFNLKGEVAPEEEGAFTMNAVAPAETGTYHMRAMISNAEDKDFYQVNFTLVVVEE